MKVIDLLNKIANGEEVPKKIAIQNKVLIYNEDEILDLQDYYIEEDDKDATWEIWAYKIDDEVEIIEDTPNEDKKIEKLDISGLSSAEAIIKNTRKLNEIIEVINERNI